MTVANVTILIMIVGGLVLIIVGFLMDSEKSFDDGSFMTKIFAIVSGSLSLALGLIWKFAMSFF